MTRHSFENAHLPLPLEPASPQALKLFCGSFHCRHLDVGSCNACDNELIALGGPHYDLQRLGIDVVASPRHADAVLLTGPVTRQSLVSTLDTYRAMPRPRLVIAVGNCACTGGVFEGSYAVFDGAHEVVPVTIRIPGCPPSPEEILAALTEGLRQLASAAEGRKTPEGAAGSA